MATINFARGQRGSMLMEWEIPLSVALVAAIEALIRITSPSTE